MIHGISRVVFRLPDKVILFSFFLTVSQYGVFVTINAHYVLHMPISSKICILCLNFVCISIFMNIIVLVNNQTFLNNDEKIMKMNYRTVLYCFIYHLAHQVA